jgi:hypothetical protein
MSTNRANMIALNRRHVTDEEARNKQSQLDTFLREPFADPANSPLIFGPVRVHNNVLTNLFRIFRIMPGTEAVVLGNGQVLEIITEGAYHHLSFPVMNRIDLYIVNTRERTLDIQTKQEFNLFYQTPDNNEIPVTVDLDVAVTYQVVRSDQVALYAEQALTTLYDTVMESMRSIVAYAKYRDFQAGGNAGYMISQQLQQRNVEDSLGIRVINVQVTRLRGAEELDQVHRDAYLKQREAETHINVQTLQARAQMQLALEDAVNRRDVARLTEITPAYLLQNNPELYSKVFGDQAMNDAQRLQMISELAQAGLLPGGNQAELRDAVASAITGRSPGQANPQLMGGAAGGALPAGRARFQSANVVDRLREEVSVLQSQGLNAFLREDMGAYYVAVMLHDSVGHSLNIYFACTPQYPREAPTMFIELDGQQQPFAPAALTNWTAAGDLIALVESVIEAFS